MLKPGLREHMFVTSQGSAHGRFTRAIANGHLTNAMMAARELGQLSLSDALAPCLLYAEASPDRYSPAAARWHARFVLKAKGLGVDEYVAALAALTLLPSDGDEAAGRARPATGSPRVAELGGRRSRYDLAFKPRTGRKWLALRFLRIL